MRVARRLCRPSEAPTPLLLAVVEPPENTLFNCKRNLGGGKSKNESKGFSGGASGRFTPAGVGAELRHFVGNRCELRHRAVPVESMTCIYVGHFFLSRS